MNAKFLLLLLGIQSSWLSAAVSLPEFDFTRAETCQEWGAAHHLTAMRPVPEGLELAIAGNDPYFHGPPRDYPEGLPLWVIIRLKSDEGGDGQVFYFRDHATEEQSAHFQVEAGQWKEVRMPIPALGTAYRLRLDPPGTNGKTTIASIRFASAAALAAPEWPKPVAVDFSKAARLRSGSLEAQVTGQGFRLLVEGQRMAESHSRPLLGYVLEDTLRWLDLSAPGSEPPRLEQADGRLKVVSTHRDADGGSWTISQIFSVAPVAGVINMEVDVAVDRERAVTFLPMLLLVAGLGEPDSSKQQGLFAGLEYLDNEPSSSEADIVGQESKRQVPASHKITIPLMTILKGGRYVGLIWEHAPEFSALFDSPDRLLGTGGHIMGVLFPGCDRYNRREGSLMPTRPETLTAGRKLVLKSQLIGGVGASVVPAIQQYLQLRGLPAVPPCGYSLPEYVSLAAHGWLDSKIRENNLFRHAVWQGFGAQPAADAAVFMNWLAGETTEATLRQRLEETARAALSVVPPQNLNHAAVSHIRYPFQSLVYGHVAENAAGAQAQARALLGRFAADGSIPYHKSPAGQDYGRTHFAPEANGLTAQVVETLLEAAAFSGDTALIDQAILRLRGLDKFRNTVPRGAQTWEVPLHTPDILASAHLVRAYTMGYELTGEKAFLDQAVYWAWSGVPFVYLTAPVGFPDRPYGTIAVYGATGWRAPVWFGRPVQWCGLVYADALYRLVRHQPLGPWKQLADGITSTGLFYSWPPSDQGRQGLLPDVWEMLAQRRDGPAINPGTVQVNAVRLFGQTPLYDFQVFHLNSRRVIVHAPGEIIPAAEKPGAVQFTLRSWPREPYYVLVNGLDRLPQLKIDGRLVPLDGPHQFQEKEKRLILRLSSQPAIEIQTDP